MVIANCYGTPVAQGKRNWWLLEATADWPDLVAGRRLELAVVAAAVGCWPVGSAS